MRSTIHATGSSLEPVREVADKSTIPATGISLERVQEVAAALADERSREISILDMSMGPDDKCLSPRRIIDILMGGATPSETEHLMQCRTCSETVRSLAVGNLQSSPGFIRAAIEKADGSDGARSNHRFPFPQSRILPAILCSQRDTFMISDPDSQNIEVQFDVIPVFDSAHLNRLDKRSLYLDGAIQTAALESAELLMTSSNSKVLRIRFHNAKLARRVREGILYHKRVMDTVRLHGGFRGPYSKGLYSKGFVAQANLEFSSGRT